MKKEELIEIKKGKTGTGLLIENDGVVKANKEVIREFHENTDWHCPNPFIVDCILQKADIKNANGRIYPRKILEREIEKYKNNMVNQKMALGELDHPSDSTISLQRISHNIIELHWEGNTVVGKLELNISEGYRRYGIVSTMGDQAANMLLNGLKFGISSRAVGTVEQKMGVLYVGSDLELLGWDLVSSPSTPGAYLGTPEELEQYKEGNTSKSDKPSLNEKINKLKNILNS